MFNGQHQQIGSRPEHDIISFPIQESDTRFFAFIVPNYKPPNTFNHTYYYTIDLELNGGVGGITDLTLLDNAWDADEKICGVKHYNNKDYWVLVRKLVEDKFASFLITNEGINPVPVLSYAPHKKEAQTIFTVAEFAGQLKISYNKKYLVNTYIGFMLRRLKILPTSLRFVGLTIKPEL